MQRLNAILMVTGALCIVVTAALLDPRLGLGVLGIFLLAASLERP